MDQRDHRLHPRIASHHAAWVEIGEMPLLATTIGNISKDGLLLHLTHPALMPTAVVQVIMEDPVSHSPWKSRAMVVHTSLSGTGVLLLNTLTPAKTGTRGAAGAGPKPSVSAEMP